MTKPIRIANCSGFYGDRLSAAREMVEGGPIDALTGDWLAELTMLILARKKAKRSNAGFAQTFITQMEQVMGTCLDKDIKVVANAGGLSPDHCAEAVAEVAARLGLSPTIAYIEGDNLLPRLKELHATGAIIDPLTREAIADINYISANAYLGCWGIVEALNRGADIVVTGRTTDAALVCGPAAWYHGWEKSDLDALAGAVVAGHVIECGTQATGGNYSFFEEIGGLEYLGFPFAEIAADGSSVISKHPETGGNVTIGTITSQLLYEIDHPAYLGPDVTSRFDTIALAEIAKDRVRISGVVGEPPPETLKVSMTSWGGFRSDLSIALTGLDTSAKAALIERAFWHHCRTQPNDFASVETSLVRTNKVDPATNEEAVATWRITVKDPDEEKTKAIASTINDLALASIPGFFATKTAGVARPFGLHTAALLPRGLVNQQVTLLGQHTTTISSDTPTSAVDHRAQPQPRSVLPTGETLHAPLGVVAGARSGDKGGNANIGVFVRQADAYPWLEYFLTTERLRQLLPEIATLHIARYALPNILSLNFVIHGILGAGVAASTRQDPQAKSLGEWLRARYVDVPKSLIVESDAATQYCKGRDGF